MSTTTLSINSTHAASNITTISTLSSSSRSSESSLSEAAIKNMHDQFLEARVQRAREQVYPLCTEFEERRPKIHLTTEDEIRNCAHPNNGSVYLTATAKKQYEEICQASPKQTYKEIREQIWSIEEIDTLVSGLITKSNLFCWGSNIEEYDIRVDLMADLLALTGFPTERLSKQYLIAPQKDAIEGQSAPFHVALHVELGGHYTCIVDPLLNPTCTLTKEAWEKSKVVDSTKIKREAQLPIGRIYSPTLGKEPPPFSFTGEVHSKLVKVRTWELQPVDAVCVEIGQRALAAARNSLRMKDIYPNGVPLKPKRELIKTV